MEINEKEVMIKGNFPIAATVTYTDERKKSPAVVIIMGTGKLDRDGNGLGFHSDMYKDLAHKFAEYGFVSARYDKRGTHKSGGNFNAAGLSDLVSDAVAVVRYLKKTAIC
ncbi:alpha/beta hydrolase [Ruminococcus sp. HUN007]|uniref:serine aminopeptidase domain-containing protein n=1 Tax=Ruminococcus sp. HUN007 TaxID=1514668 RepID=UPI0005D1FA6E|nr:alpha/beta hydrolase [Ruminococcus sp. HUN007]